MLRLRLNENIDVQHGGSVAEARALALQPCKQHHVNERGSRVKVMLMLFIRVKLGCLQRECFGDSARTYGR